MEATQPESVYEVTEGAGPNEAPGRPELGRPEPGRPGVREERLRGRTAERLNGDPKT